MNCPNCNNIIPDDSIFCPECGLQQRDIPPVSEAPAFDRAVSESEAHVFNETAPTSESPDLGNIPKEAPIFDAPATAPYGAPAKAPSFVPYTAPIPTVKKEADVSKDGFAVSSLVIGILSLFGGGISFAIASLVFGIIGTKSTKKGVSVAGIVISAIAILLTILMVVLMVLVFIGIITEAYGAVDEFANEFGNSMGYGYYY